MSHEERGIPEDESPQDPQSKPERRPTPPLPKTESQAEDEDKPAFNGKVGTEEEAPPMPGAPSPHGNHGSISQDSPVASYFNLYRWHPFTELYCVIGEWFEPGESPIEQRRKMRQHHPLGFRAAVALDYALLLFIVVLIISAVLFVALRAVGVSVEIVKIPIPWF